MRVEGPTVEVADRLAGAQGLRHVGVAVQDGALLDEAVDDDGVLLGDAADPADVTQVHLLALDVDLVLERDRQAMQRSCRL